MSMRPSTEYETGQVQDQLERLVGLLGTYSSVVLKDRILEEATGGELTPAQLDALEFIHHHGGCSAKALSEGLHISIPSSTRMVDRMVRKHLVDRRENGEDRRLVMLTVTATGSAALKAVRAAHLARLQQALAPFKPHERSVMLALLERFLHAVLCDIQTVEDCCLHCGSDHNGDCVVNEAHIALVGHPIVHP